MNDILRDRILRKLDALPQERVYQILDYIEFLEGKYASKPAPSPDFFQRFAEGVEDTLRAGRVSATTIGETMGYMSKAMGVLSAAVAAGKSVANDIAGSTSSPPSSSSSSPPSSPPPSTTRSEPAGPSSPPSAGQPPQGEPPK